MKGNLLNFRIFPTRVSTVTYLKQELLGSETNSRHPYEEDEYIGQDRDSRTKRIQVRKIPRRVVRL